MKKLSHKKIFIGLAAILGTGLLAGCTANFCSEEDQAQMAYPYEQGVTVYLSKNEYDTLKSADETKALIAEEESQGIAGPAFVNSAGTVINEGIYKYVPYKLNDNKQIEFTAAKSTFLQSIISSAYKSGLVMPSLKYWASIDDYVLQASTYHAETGKTYTVGQNASEDFIKKIVATMPRDSKKEESATKNNEGPYYLNPYTKADYNGEGGEEICENSILRRNGYVKFSGQGGSLWGYWTSWNAELYKSSDPSLGMDNVPTKDFTDYYKSQVATKVNQNRSCIATQKGQFGHYGNSSDWEVNISKKDWGYAWSKGFLEGLLVYPVSWLVDTFAYGMDQNLTGVGQIWAIVFVTLIVRCLLLLVSFRSTMDSQKMQALQPELAKLQAKYPNSNTNQAEKQRLATEQMALYKRHKIKPFRQILILIVQFPVFICVWSGLQGSAALSSGEFLGMRLSDNISSILFNVKGTWYLNENGWWTALVLFILMAATQVMAMMLPRIMSKSQTKKMAKLSANPAQTDSQKQMKWVSIFMLVFTIIMGFMLPSAMGVYWLIGGLISMIQTLITQLVISKKSKEKRGTK